MFLKSAVSLAVAAVAASRLLRRAIANAIEEHTQRQHGKHAGHHKGRPVVVGPPVAVLVRNQEADIGLGGGQQH